MNKSRGKFIVFEGIDGCGKTTQIEMLTDSLNKFRIYPYLTKEPTDSPIGSLIRQVLSGKVVMDNKALQLLFAADRMDHITNETSGIAKELDKGNHVICDRYYFSTFAYCDTLNEMEYAFSANSEAMKIAKPDVVIYLDVDPIVAMGRVNARSNDKDIFEDVNKLTDVRNMYYNSFKRMTDNDEKIYIVDGNRSMRDINKDIWRIVKPLVQ